MRESNDEIRIRNEYIGVWMRSERGIVSCFDYERGSEGERKLI